MLINYSMQHTYERKSSHLYVFHFHAFNTLQLVLAKLQHAVQHTTTDSKPTLDVEEISNVFISAAQLPIDE